jgi:hypothetical protein
MPDVLRIETPAPAPQPSLEETLAAIASSRAEDR